MSDERDYHQEVLRLLEAQIPFVSVTLVDAIGSAPQNIGARMLVGEQGLLWGTIGGGKVEMASLAKSRELLQSPDSGPFFYAEWNLQKDIGMTCGGVVRLYFERFVQSRWQIAVFGAGHVAQALVPLLSTLNCRLLCIDSRQEWLDRLPESSNLSKICSPQPADEVARLPRSSFLVSMTMGHAHDVPILTQALRIRAEDPQAFPFMGVIGSPAKAGIIRRDLAKLEFSKEQQQSIICPLGLPLGNNDPAEIAVSISAQLLQVRDSLLPGNKWSKPGYQSRRKS